MNKQRVHMAFVGCTSISREFFFFFNDTATTEIYTLSLHDALPIFSLQKIMPVLRAPGARNCCVNRTALRGLSAGRACPSAEDRKSTRLNSSHANISSGGFCLT